MRNFWELLKVDLRETLDFRRFKENKGKSISFMSVMLLFGLLIMVVSGFITISFAEICKMNNLSYEPVLIMISGLASMITFTTSVFKVKSIFVGKDLEMLKSMPIKKSSIIGAKITNLYIVELIFSILILVPCIGVLAYFSKDLKYVWYGIPLMFLSPAVPLIISIFISLFITLVADRYRFGNVISIILYIVLFVGIFYLSMSMNQSGNMTSEEFTSMTSAFKFINPSLLIFTKSFDSVGYLLLFIGGNLGLLIISVLIIALLMDPVHSLINNYTSSNVYKRKDLQVKKQFKTLVSFEFKRLFNSKFYLINSLSAVIAGIAVAVVTSISINEGLAAEDQQLVEMFKKYYIFGAPLIMLMVGISSTASCGINIEMNKLWIVKSMPVDYKAYAKAKILVSTVFTFIGTLISSVAMTIILKPDLPTIVAIITITCVYSFLVGIIGLLMNICYIKVKWTSETDVAKKSTSVIFAMLLNWAVTLVCGVIMVVLVIAGVNIYVITAVICALLIALIITCYYLAIGNIEKKLLKVEEL